MQEPTILELGFLPNYILKLRFSTNETKYFDATACTRGEWGKELKNPKYFELARISDDRTFIEWPNGIDICPDTLYETSSSTCP
ncbi:MAG: DUF2442 domain-containing protein [Holophagaceae bacterium]|nr:DUF2442 domain-containing protein [Holophagaceae bacterium]